MKYNINNLYFAKCRHCIMDIINVTDDNGNVLVPHPDYVDYYTVLLLKDGEYTNVYNKNIKYKNISQVDNNQEHYIEDLIIEICSLTDYIDTEYKKISTKECKKISTKECKKISTKECKKISTKECELIDDTIQKTKSLRREYGYKK